MVPIIRFSRLALLSSTIALAFGTVAVACEAPRIHFEYRSAELPRKFTAFNEMRRSDPSCRYTLTGHVSVYELREDPTRSLAKRRAEAVADGFARAGIARSRFDVVVGSVEYPGLIRSMVVIQSAPQPGRVECRGTPTCPSCILRLPSGGECLLLSGGEF